MGQGGSKIEPINEPPETDKYHIQIWLNRSLWAKIEELAHTIDHFKGFDELMADDIEAIAEPFEKEFPIREDIFAIAGKNKKRRQSQVSNMATLAKKDEKMRIADL